ncbi:uncharacterized protein Dwil_GK18201 [Drosophila willistoni]|uniref:Cytoplasmic tRNA 2-thiolation protein 2 n=1 Tax=Drosophila willistoni TaxID=7260 RepID=CTU2_DROWI|nr:cytoplasmic tRNA 2-thiolation protein 2 [Drosophila willistoni]B4MYR2.1 RecName: Full=Cytoplasmic tRNA 2-thiolation protein 2 [Drosophila willistoni]EDW77251.1 uncharacterized protein Dwil_GK18201 [Drosophila willistoni]
MCSIGEDDFGDTGGLHAMTAGGPVQIATGGTGECQKCGQHSDDLFKVNFRSEECRDCFLNYARHKFRAALGAAKALPRDSDVLLLLDGSIESIVLLDMLHYAQTQNTFKRLHCQAKVLYLDESVVQEQQSLDIDRLQKLQDRYTPFDLFVIELGTDLSNLRPLKNYTPKTSREESDLKIKLDKLRTLSARQDYLQQQRKRFLASVAHQLNCTHVFVPSISKDLATQFLTSIALGRGGSAALDVALCDDRLDHDIKLLRPLKDLNEQEVQLYVRARNLEDLKLGPSLATYGQEKGETASLQNLTAAFVRNLQENYAATVSTVFRTGNKIAPNRHVDQDMCQQCQSPLDSLLSDTLLAIEYSRVVSLEGSKLSNHNNDLEQLSMQRLNKDDRLCHACRNVQDEYL